MRSKKNEPFSNLEKRAVHVTRKGPPVTPAVLGIETTRTASSATSVEEITTPISKRPHLTDKGRRRLIPIRPVFGMMLDLQWKGHMRLSLLRT